MSRNGKPAKPPRRARVAAMLAFVLAGSGLCLAGCRTPRSSAASFRSEIEARNRELESSFREGDLLGVADVYADDARILGPDAAPVEGRSGIDEYWSDIARPLDWRLEIHELGGSEALVYELGTSRMTRLVDGVPQTVVVDFLLLWRRDAARAWRIVLDVYWAALEP